MAQKTRDSIRWADGPYWVDKATAERVAKTAKYRHYKPDELEILRYWIRGAPIQGNYYFDAYLMTPQAEDIVRKLGAPTLRAVVPWLKRIDCLVDMGDKVWIIEVKDRLRASGFGQLAAYENLFKKQYGADKPVLLGYVCRNDDPSLHPLLEQNNVRLWVVPLKGGWDGY